MEGMYWIICVFLSPKFTGIFILNVNALTNHFTSKDNNSQNFVELESTGSANLGYLIYYKTGCGFGELNLYSAKNIYCIMGTSIIVGLNVWFITHFHAIKDKILKFKPIIYYFL
jgi:hypothetical protein